jgi:hypothetical protein
VVVHTLSLIWKMLVVAVVVATCMAWLVTAGALAGMGGAVE